MPGVRPAQVLLFSFALALCALPRTEAAGSAAAAPARRIYTATRLTGQTPVIDGRLDDAAWQKLGSWDTDYIQREPHEGAKASLPTAIKILYDNRTLFVAIRAQQPGAANSPRLMGSRDEFTGDMVGIALDSYHSLRSAFEFDVSSGGSKIDLILRNDGSADTSWNAVWNVRTSADDVYWYAEYAIPLSQLRYGKAPSQVWGLHSWRWIQSKQEESNWNLLPMDNKGLVYSFGELHGLEGLPASRPFELSPYVLARAHRYGAEPGNPFRTGRANRIDGGLDAKYGIGSDLTLDLTLNPDFSQVDADPSEINLSTVETFQKERRPFFLEGREIFEVKLDDDVAFYSRRIGDAPSLSAQGEGFHESPAATRILGSAKLTGRTSQGLSLGLLHATTSREETRILAPDGTPSSELAEPLTNATVARLQQDFDGGNTLVGAFFSSAIRQGSSSELRSLPVRAFCAGFDATRYFSNRDYRIEARVLATQVAGSTESITSLMSSPVHNYQRADATHIEVDPNADTLQGHAGKLSGGRVAGLWRWNGFVSWRSPGVDFNDLGYLQTADAATGGAQVQYYNATPVSFLRRRDLRLKVFQTQDFDQLVTTRQVQLESELASMSGAYLWSRLAYQTDRVDTRILRGGPALRLGDRIPFNFYVEDTGAKSIQAIGEGEVTAYQNGSHYLRVAPGFNYKPNSHLKASLQFAYEENNQYTDYAGTAHSGPTPVYMVGHLRQHVMAPTLRLNLNFTPSLSLSYYGGPFATRGRYDALRAVTHPRAHKEADRFTAVSMSPDNSGTLLGTLDGQPLKLNNPDFDWREFKSNLVFRWEYRPGSSLTCVWSQYRSDWSSRDSFTLAEQGRALFSAHPDNTLLVKLNYWFSL